MFSGSGDKEPEASEGQSANKTFLTIVIFHYIFNFLHNPSLFQLFLLPLSLSPLIRQAPLLQSGWASRRQSISSLITAPPGTRLRGSARGSMPRWLLSTLLKRRSSWLIPCERYCKSLVLVHHPFHLSEQCTLCSLYSILCCCKLHINNRALTLNKYEHGCAKIAIVVPALFNARALYLVWSLQVW